ncbi:hypothetical protein H4R20_001375 [Coemansia guatemalensis]|uniref:Transcription initiation factor TFIID subunit 4 n=1 Tax=Coemansia guatemalensis TaxID=2761395 RepID=A0A9W8I3H1_9FUNG|nr:hypothetical protein H4R20_001375 [Coemansia guatemalensis]
MADEDHKHANAGTPNTSQALQALLGLGGSGNSGSNNNVNSESIAGSAASATGSPAGGIDLMSLLAGNGPQATTATPIDTDIDQLMRSLGGTIDTSRVSDADIDQLLGSISAEISADAAQQSAPIPGRSTSAVSRPPTTGPGSAFSPATGHYAASQPQIHTHAQPLQQPQPLAQPQPRPRGSDARPMARPGPRARPATPVQSAGPGVRPSVRPAGDPSRWLAATMSTLPAAQQERLATLFRGLQTKAVDFATFTRDAEAIMGPRFHDMLALMRTPGARPPPPPPQSRTPRPARPMQAPLRPASTRSPATAAPANAPLAPSPMARPAGSPFEAAIARWRQIILNPTIPGEQLARLSMQLSAFGDLLANPTGPMAAIAEEERNMQFAQIAKLQALIAQRQYARGTAPSSRPASPQPDSLARDAARRPPPLRGVHNTPKPKKRPSELRRQDSLAKKPRTGSDAELGGALLQQAASDSVAASPSADDGASEDDVDRSKGAKDGARRARERRERTAAATGDAFSIDDVIGYTGVDLREESEMIFGGGLPHHAPRSAHDAPALSSHAINGVVLARDRRLCAAVSNVPAIEARIARICRAAHIGAVAADVAPCLALALQQRLRAFMERVSAAAHHRTRTQTLPPPPLDPSTRLPLYKITPNQDVRRQLLIVERADRLREQTRRAARDREHEAHVEPQAPEDADAEPRAQQPKRSRKKDDAAESPAYTSKNMPEEVQSRISNLTALRAAGGVRKSWMTAAAERPATPDAPDSPAPPAHRRSHSSQGAASDDEAATPTNSRPLRSATLSAPLLVTVRDCLFSLERERLGSVRVARGGGERVLIQAYSKFGMT